MKIYYFSPYSLEKKLGKAYNEYISLVPSDNDWICLTDMDMMFLGKDVGRQLERIVEMNPHIGVFTCLTNRIGTKIQLESGMWDISDIRIHRERALYLQNERTYEIEIVNQKISGMLMLFSKTTWRQAGGFKEQGLLHVDYDFTDRVLKQKKDIAVMRGVYVLHYYRLNEGSNDVSHLG